MSNCSCNKLKLPPLLSHTPSSVLRDPTRGQAAAVLLVGARVHALATQLRTHAHSFMKYSPRTKQLLPSPAHTHTFPSRQRTCDKPRARRPFIYQLTDDLFTKQTRQTNSRCPHRAHLLKSELLMLIVSIFGVRDTRWCCVTSSL